MAKDLEFTSKVPVNIPGVARKDEVLQKLVAAWSSKNAQAGKRVGTFGFMAATLSACGGSEGDSVDRTPGSASQVSMFKFLDESSGFLRAYTFTADSVTAKGGILGRSLPWVCDGCVC